MALIKATQFGAQYKWGFKSTDAPNFGPTFVARAADLSIEPEVSSTATDGEGHVDSHTVSLAAQRKITGSFTGYVTDAFNADSFIEGFSWIPAGISASSRYFVITKIGLPVKKGDYVEVTVEVESHKGITGPA